MPPDPILARDHGPTGSRLSTKDGTNDDSRSGIGEAAGQDKITSDDPADQEMDR